MKHIEIYLDEAIGFWSIAVDGEVAYECLNNDEVTDVVKELMQK